MPLTTIPVPELAPSLYAEESGPAVLSDIAEERAWIPAYYAAQLSVGTGAQAA
ncbi:hypothetical protein GTY75_20920 [Streptomyces sp. SID8381]|uniref:hypothetical protein n=1 Tax=unclassified Streptomyces TaxID=2593676 RepID=UPI00035C5659|nr:MULTISPECIES: hypothetical protein [unclassified Streptomyces]MYX29064.1 hypothetical protein [Streptomyces sp. SID8381]